ncbi:MAG: hypothetical protein HYY17_07715 [Planctomycetes bacterium]|nr:hypothetical protein [Planctomycetota bacterium]
MAQDAVRRLGRVAQVPPLLFRTRYAIDLDRAKLLAVADRALSAMPVVEEDVRAFVELVKGR